jgi:predicted transcriptional regulator of viral defense system
MAVKFSNTGTCRRLGFLLEKEKIGEDVLTKLEKEITNSSSFIPFIPDRPKKGSTNKRWGIVDNEA